jgi:hypothetical protein
MKIEGFAVKLKKQIEKYSFEVGILDDTSAKTAIKGTLSNFAGGPVRKGFRDEFTPTMKELATDLQEKYDWLNTPFKSEENREIRNFGEEYVKQVIKDGEQPNIKRLENLMQAIVRNPILRGDYGHNTPQAIQAKGFDRLMIDTGTFFKSIKARAVRT